MLGRFLPEQLDAIAPALEEATEAAAVWATRGCTEAMNRFNRKQTPPEQKTPEEASS